MDDAHHALMAVAEWRGLVDRAETEFAAGALGAADGDAAAHARSAVALARATLASLEADAASQQASPGAAAVPPARTDSPAEARRIKHERDALLRLGVWVALGDWAAAVTPAGKPLRPSLIELITCLGRDRRDVPPGIAPAPAYAGSAEADAFFNRTLSGVIDALAGRHGRFAAAFAAVDGAAPMNRTIAAAQRASRVWTNLVCAVFVDWLHRRGHGAFDDARHSLWQFGPKHRPVQFRSPPHLAALPTGDRRIQADVWTQLVLAQLLDKQASRWRSAAVDGRWFATRLSMRELTSSADHAKDGDGRLYTGLAVGMVFQTLFIDRMSGLVADARTQEADMQPMPQGDASPAFDVPMPACCPGQRLTMRVVWEWRPFEDPPVATAARLARTSSAIDNDLELAYHAWRAEQMCLRRQRDRDCGVERINIDLIAIEPADGAEADGCVRLCSVDLSTAGVGSALWIDTAAVARLPGRWVDLPIQLVDDPTTTTTARHWLCIDSDLLGDLKAHAIDPALLTSHLTRGADSLWLCRRAGAGVFLTIGVDLTAPDIAR